MANTVHHNFTQTSDAESARSDLLAAGFQAAAVTLNSHAAVAADTGTSVVDNLMQGLTSGKTSSTGPKPAALLSIDVDDEQQAAQAAAIVQRYGATEA